MNPRVIAFIRVSTEEQAAEGRAGLLRQREDIHSATVQYGLKVIRTLELTDVSGAAVMEASEFQEMLADLARPDIDGVVCSAQDRLARPETLGGMVVFDPFMRHGKKIWTPAQVIDLGEDSGFLTSGVLALIAGLERKQMLCRVRSAKEAQRRRGRHPNSKLCLPRGVDFDFKTGNWSWVEPWASHIRRAFELLLDGASVRSIAAEIGYTPRGLGIALRNPIWTGRRLYSHRRGEKYPSRNGRQVDRKKVLRPEPLEVILNIEPLIDAATWERAQQILLTTNRTWNIKRSLPSRLLAGGLGYCSCGQRLYTRGDLRPGKHDLYICKSRFPKGNGCGAPAIHRDILDRTVETLVSNIFLQPRALGGLVAMSAKISAKQPGAPDIDRAQQQLRKLNEQRERIVHLAVQGLCSEDELAKERKRIDEEAAIWSRQAKTKPAHTFDPKQVAQQIANLFAEFEFLAPDQKKSLLLSCISKIVANRSGITELRIRHLLPVATPGTHTDTRACFNCTFERVYRMPVRAHTAA